MSSRRFPKSLLAFMPGGQLHLDEFFGGGFGLVGTQPLLPPVAPRHGHIPKAVGVLSSICDRRRNSFRFVVHLSQNPKMLWEPEQHPDRHTAEDDKPGKRKADNQVVSVHGRFCQMMSGLAASADSAALMR
jgi:hypothetical protein